MTDNKYTSPLDNITITSGFGERNISEGSNNHLGIDLSGHIGDSVYSIATGKVIFSSFSNNPAEQVNGYGNVIVVQHSDGCAKKVSRC